MITIILYVHVNTSALIHILLAVKKYVVIIIITFYSVELKRTGRRTDGYVGELII